MTMEGCVVRVSDTISYVGRDIEDAITLGIVRREDIPPDCAEVLGNNNRDIVNNLVVDVIENSYNQPFIALGPDTARALRQLKDFNHERIYSNKDIKAQAAKIQRMFGLVFDAFLDDLKTGRKESRIYTNYVNSFSPERWKRYAEGTSEPEMVRDFIAGMTDEFFNDTFRELYLPQKKSMY
jgi:dGTPase